MAKFGDTISSPTCDYSVRDTVGSGGFGTVVVCNKKNTPDLVVLKIIKNAKAMAGSKSETNIMKKMLELGSQNFNIITWADSFMAGNLFCMELERLDISIHDYMKRNSFSLKEIRPLIQQMGVALQFLGANGLIHADLKPQNIMLVDHIREPLRFKLIDFGLAHSVPMTRTGRVCGTLPYIAPEMLLGAPYTNAIDTWALGCVAVQMISRKVLLPGANAAEVLRLILLILGSIPNHVINSGCYTQNYFVRAFAPYFQSFVWILRQPFVSAGGTNLPPYCIKSLNELLMVPNGTTLEDAQAEVIDRIAFVELLTKMLNVDPYHRITPSDILKHPFITLSHLDSNYDSYRQNSINIMRVCPEWCADEKKHVPPCSPATSGSEQSSRDWDSEDSDCVYLGSSQQTDKETVGITLACSSPPKEMLIINPGGTARKSMSKNSSKPKIPTSQNNPRKRKREETKEEADPSPHVKPKIPTSQNNSRKRTRVETEQEAGPSPHIKIKIPTSQNNSRKRKREETEQEAGSSPYVKPKIPTSQNNSRKRTRAETKQEAGPSPYVKPKIPTSQNNSRKREETEQEAGPSPYVKPKIPTSQNNSGKRKREETEQEAGPSPYVKPKIPTSQNNSRKRTRVETEQEAGPSPYVKPKIPTSQNNSRKRTREETEQEAGPSPYVKPKIPSSQNNSRKRTRAETEQEAGPSPYVKPKIPSSQNNSRKRTRVETEQEAGPSPYVKPKIPTSQNNSRKRTRAETAQEAGPSPYVKQMRLCPL